MGSPYLSSNESIILSTNDVVVNAVPAEAILTNERLMLIDTRHAALRPQDVPFYAIETVTLGESATQDPMLSLSVITGQGLTQTIAMVFPQPPRMKRVAERDEWAARLKELSIVSARDISGSRATELLPPWVPGPLPDEGEGAPAPAPETESGSALRHAPLAPRRARETAAPRNSMAVAAVVLVIVVIAVAAVAYVFAPSRFGRGGTAVPTITPTPVPTQMALPTTVATPPVTPSVITTPQVIIPRTGIWVRVQYEDSFVGNAGAPERMTNISSTGDTIHQLSVRDEVISATVQKLDNTGKKLTVELYSYGKLIKSGSTSSPKGTVVLNADLRTL